MSRLKSELSWLRRKGAIKVGQDDASSRTCGRCQAELGFLLNRGAFCPSCRQRVCKDCRHHGAYGKDWVCLVCSKQIEIQLATGEWMNEFIRRPSRRKERNFLSPVEGVRKALVRRSWSISSPTAYSCDVTEEFTIRNQAPRKPPRKTLPVDENEPPWDSATPEKPPRRRNSLSSIDGMSAKRRTTRIHSAPSSSDRQLKNKSYSHSFSGLHDSNSQMHQSQVHQTHQSQQQIQQSKMQQMQQGIRKYYFFGNDSNDSTGETPRASTLPRRPRKPYNYQSEEQDDPTRFHSVPRRRVSCSYTGSRGRSEPAPYRDPLDLVGYVSSGPITSVPIGQSTINQNVSLGSSSSVSRLNNHSAPHTPQEPPLIKSNSVPSKYLDKTSSNYWALTGRGTPIDMKLRSDEGGGDIPQVRRLKVREIMNANHTFDSGVSESSVGISPLTSDEGGSPQEKRPISNTTLPRSNTSITSGFASTGRQRKSPKAPVRRCKSFQSGNCRRSLEDELSMPTRRLSGGHVAKFVLELERGIQQTFVNMNPKRGSVVSLDSVKEPTTIHSKDSPLISRNHDGRSSGRQSDLSSPDVILDSNKILPDGDDYKIVFISSSDSSKESELNSSGDSDSSINQQDKAWNTSERKLSNTPREQVKDCNKKQFVEASVMTEEGEEEGEDEEEEEKNIENVSFPEEIINKRNCQSVIHVKENPILQWPKCSNSKNENANLISSIDTLDPNKLELMLQQTEIVQAEAQALQKALMGAFDSQEKANSTPWLFEDGYIPQYTSKYPEEILPRGQIASSPEHNLPIKESGKVKKSSSRKEKLYPEIENLNASTTTSEYENVQNNKNAFIKQSEANIYENVYQNVENIIPIKVCKSVSIQTDLEPLSWEEEDSYETTDYSDVSCDSLYDINGSGHNLPHNAMQISSIRVPPFDICIDKPTSNYNMSIKNKIDCNNVKGQESHSLTSSPYLPELSPTPLTPISQSPAVHLHLALSKDSPSVLLSSECESVREAFGVIRGRFRGAESLNNKIKNVSEVISKNEIKIKEKNNIENLCISDSKYFISHSGRARASSNDKNTMSDLSPHLKGSRVDSLRSLESDRPSEDCKGHDKKSVTECLTKMTSTQDSDATSPVEVDELEYSKSDVDAAQEVILNTEEFLDEKHIKNGEGSNIEPVSSDTSEADDTDEDAHYSRSYDVSEIGNESDGICSNNSKNAKESSPSASETDEEKHVTKKYDVTKTSSENEKTIAGEKKEIAFKNELINKNVEIKEENSEGGNGGNNEIILEKIAEEEQYSEDINKITESKVEIADSEVSKDEVVEMQIDDVTSTASNKIPENDNNCDTNDSEIKAIESAVVTNCLRENDSEMIQSDVINNVEKTDLPECDQAIENSVLQCNSDQLINDNVINQEILTDSVINSAESNRDSEFQLSVDNTSDTDNDLAYDTLESVTENKSETESNLGLDQDANDCSEDSLEEEDRQTENDIDIIANAEKEEERNELIDIINENALNQDKLDDNNSSKEDKSLIEDKLEENFDKTQSGNDKVSEVANEDNDISVEDKKCDSPLSEQDGDDGGCGQPVNERNAKENELNNEKGNDETNELQELNLIAKEFETNEIANNKEVINTFTLNDNEWESDKDSDKTLVGKDDGESCKDNSLTGFNDSSIDQIESIIKQDLEEATLAKDLESSNQSGTQQSFPDTSVEGKLEKEKEAKIDLLNEIVNCEHKNNKSSKIDSNNCSECKPAEITGSIEVEHRSGSSSSSSFADKAVTLGTLSEQHEEALCSKSSDETLLECLNNLNIPTCDINKENNSEDCASEKEGIKSKESHHYSSESGHSSGGESDVESKEINNVVKINVPKNNDGDSCNKSDCKVDGRVPLKLGTVGMGVKTESKSTALHRRRSPSEFSKTFTPPVPIRKAKRSSSSDGLSSSSDIERSDADASDSAETIIDNRRIQTKNNHSLRKITSDDTNRDSDGPSSADSVLQGADSESQCSDGSEEGNLITIVAVGEDAIPRHTSQGKIYIRSDSTDSDVQIKPTCIVVTGSSGIESCDEVGNREHSRKVNIQGGNDVTILEVTSDHRKDHVMSVRVTSPESSRSTSPARKSNVSELQSMILTTRERQQQFRRSPVEVKETSSLTNYFTVTLGTDSPVTPRRTNKTPEVRRRKIPDRETNDSISSTPVLATTPTPTLTPSPSHTPSPTLTPTPDHSEGDLLAYEEFHFANVEDSPDKERILEDDNVFDGFYDQYDSYIDNDVVQEEADGTFDSIEDGDSIGESPYSETSSEEGFEREEELRGYCKRAYDFTLHTIIEESCEESDYEKKQQEEENMKRDPSELEKYFFFGLGNGPSESKKFANEESEYSDTFSETSSSIYSEGMESIDGNYEEQMDPAELASSRLEKYFSGFLGFERQPSIRSVGEESEIHTDESGSVGSDSEGSPSPEQPRKKLFRSRGVRSVSSSRSHGYSSDKGEGVISDGSLHSGEDGEEKTLVSGEDEGSTESEETAFDKGDGQFDTIKRRKKKKVISESTEKKSDNEKLEPKHFVAENKDEEFVIKKSEMGQRLFYDLDPTAKKLLNEEANSSKDKTEDLFESDLADRKYQSRDSGFIGSSDDLLKDKPEDSSSKDPDVKEKPAGESGSDDLESKNISQNEKADKKLENIQENGSKELSADNETNNNKSENEERSSNEGKVSRSSTGSSVDLPPYSQSKGAQNLSRKDSFNNWSSDEETNIMMNKMRIFFKNMFSSVSKEAQKGQRVKSPQLVMFEAKLTNLMRSVPGLNDEQVKEIVEYLSSEETWSDSYDSSDYTSSDLEGAYARLDQADPELKSELQEQISASCQQIIKKFDQSREPSDTDSAHSLFGGRAYSESSEDASLVSKDTVFVYQKLMSSISHMKPDSDRGSIGSGSQSTSPPLLMKVMHHIRDRLVALMHEVSVGSENGDDVDSFNGGNLVTSSPRQKLFLPKKHCTADNVSLGSSIDKSSLASTSFESEDSPTDTEQSPESETGTPKIFRRQKLAIISERSSAEDFTSLGSQRSVFTSHDISRQYFRSDISKQSQSTSSQKSLEDRSVIGVQYGRSRERDAWHGVSVDEDKFGVREYTGLSKAARNGRRAEARKAKSHLSLEKIPHEEVKTAGERSESLGDLLDRVRSSSEFSSSYEQLDSDSTLKASDSLDRHIGSSSSNVRLNASSRGSLTTSSRGSLAASSRGSLNASSRGSLQGSSGPEEEEERKGKKLSFFRYARRSSVPDATKDTPSPEVRSTTLPRSTPAQILTTGTLPRSQSSQGYPSRSPSGLLTSQTTTSSSDRPSYHNNGPRSARYHPPGYRPPPAGVPPKRAFSTPTLRKDKLWHVTDESGACLEEVNVGPVSRAPPPPSRLNRMGGFVGGLASNTSSRAASPLGGSLGRTSGNESAGGSLASFENSPDEEEAKRHDSNGARSPLIALGLNSRVRVPQSEFSLFSPK